MKDLADRLEQHNRWRRGEELPHTDPTQLGRDLDEAVRLLREYAERELKHTKQ